MRWTAFWATAAMVFVLAPLVLLVGAGQALACSCAGEAQSVHYERADAVFAAKLVSREEPPQRPVMSSMDPATLTFEVSRVYKGDVESTQRVRTAQSGASCGLEITGEGPFLVFAETDGADLTASLCGGTRALGAGAAASLGAGQSPDPARSSPPGDEPREVASDSGSAVPALVMGGLGALAALGVVGYWVFVLRRRGGAS